MNNLAITNLVTFISSLSFEEINKDDTLKNYLMKVTNDYEDSGINDSYVHFYLGTNEVLISGFLGTGSYCLDDPDYEKRAISIDIKR